jgi:hypothetical protein
MTTAKLKTIKKYLINNLNKGFIKASQALYTAPMLFVKKPDCDSSGGMSLVHVLLMCTRLPLSKQDTLASVSKAIKARPYIL